MTEIQRRPRVLFAIGGLGSGGSERQLSELIASLHPDRVEAHLLLADDPGPNPRRDRIVAAGASIQAIGARGPRFNRLVRTFVRGLAVAREQRPDVIYAWLEETAFTMTLIARLLGIPAIIARRNISGGGVEQRSRVARLAMRRVERMAGVVTANSEAVLSEAVNRGVDPARIVLARNGHPRVPALPPAPESPIEIGYLARFRTEKGHLRLIELAGRIHSSVDWRVNLGGTGPLEDRIREEIGARGLAHRFRFVGEVSNAREFWGAQHIGLLLSDHEGSPNALLEAAYAGRPVVGTRVGGMPELCDEPGGRFFDVADHAGIAAALELLLESRAERERAGATAHADVSRRYTMEASAAAHMEAIERAITS